MEVGLLIVSAGGYKECAELLLDAGADVDCADENGNTPLILATTNNHEDLVEYILTKPVNINKQNLRFLEAPIHKATENGNLTIVKGLVAAGADISLMSYDAQTPLVIAVCGGHLELVKFFLEEGCDPNGSQTPALESLLHLAAERGYYDISVELIDAGVNVNHEDITETTPLQCAASNGHVNIMKLLLNAGADINGSCKDHTVLHSACLGGSVECVDLILKHKDFVRVYEYSIGKYSAVAIAIFNNHMELAKHLIKLGFSAKCKYDESLDEQRRYFTIRFEDYCPFLIATCIAEGKFNMAKFLFATGQYTFQDLRNEVGLLDPDQITNEVADWIKEVQRQPCSLSHLCRTVINDSLRNHMINKCETKSKQRLPVIDQSMQNIQALEIPRILEQFLNFKDL